MCTAVDIERAGAADTLTAVVIEAHRAAVSLATLIKSDRIDLFIYKLLVQDVHHLQERGVGADAVDVVGLKMTFGLGVLLTPYFKCKFHNLF